MNTMQPYDIYELMIIPPNKKAEMIISELRKDEPNLELVNDLITLGADLNWQNSYGWTALHSCAYYNRPEIARMLIDDGADLNITSENGWTALHWCALNNRLEISRMLLDAGADETILNNSGKLPYELAESKELEELLKV